MKYKIFNIKMKGCRFKSLKKGCQVLNVCDLQSLFTLTFKYFWFEDFKVYRWKYDLYNNENKKSETDSWFQ
jgi:hypothetical protein